MYRASLVSAESALLQQVQRPVQTLFLLAVGSDVRPSPLSAELRRPGSVEDALQAEVFTMRTGHLRWTSGRVLLG